MAKKPLPPVGVLRQLLRYEQDTGKLFWLPRPLEMFESGKFTARHNWLVWNSRFAGTEAFTSINKGYRVGAIYRQNVCAHRVAWALVTGAWPTDQIDHINHDRTDNRWANLRVATPVENSRNQSMMASNTSGVCGVSWHRGAGKWRAQIDVAGKQKHLGLFDSMEDAVVCRKDAEAKYGFHENHGKAAA